MAYILCPALGITQSQLVRVPSCRIAFLSKRESSEPLPMAGCDLWHVVAAFFPRQVLYDETVHETDFRWFHHDNLRRRGPPRRRCAVPSLPVPTQSVRPHATRRQPKSAETPAKLSPFPRQIRGPIRPIFPLSSISFNSVRRRRPTRHSRGSCCRHPRPCRRRRPRRSCHCHRHPRCCRAP